MTNGWPTAASVSNVLTDFTGFTFTSANPALFTFVTSCEVQYNDSNPPGAFPVVTVVSTGC
jgi:hypothetical protein